MKGFRLYAELPQARKSKSASKAAPFFPWTVAALTEHAAQGFRCDLIAVYLDPVKGNPLWQQGAGLVADCISTGIEGNRYSYTSTGVSQDYLRARCTRIPESLARQLDPGFIRHLES